MTSRGSTRRSMLGLLGTAPVAAGALLANPAAASAGTEPAQVPKGLRPGGEYDKFVAAQAAADRFSGTVMVARQGRPVLTHSFGMANKQLSIPNRADTIFDLESITKTFTAVALGQLVEQGKVAIHEKLGTYLDGFPDEIANTVTVHQLLTHTSGMGMHGNDFTGTQEFLDNRLSWTSGQQTMDAITAIIRKSPLLFTPGTRHAYSNNGMFVVGAIVEQVSGQSYYDYVRQHVFAPAGMTDTDFYTRPQIRGNPRIAHEYVVRATTGEKFDLTASDQFGFIGTPVQGSYATAADLLRYAHALQSGVLLSPSFSALFTSAKVALSPSDIPVDPSPYRFYGYGFRVKIVNDRTVFGHSGGGPGDGTTTNLDSYPDLDWVGVVLSNYGIAIAPIVGLEQQLVTNNR